MNDPTRQDLTLTPPPTNDPPMVAMMERLALNPELPVEKLEKLLEMQLKVRAIEAETAFNNAMSMTQGEMRRVSTDAANPQTNSKYASYGQLDRHLRPIYTKYGFAVSFDEAPTQSTDSVSLLAYVSHNAGHTRTYRKTMPIVTTGMKGNVMMTPTHAKASADSYGKRYLLKDIFNIAIGEDDNDGNHVTSNAPTITERQVADLEALLTEVGYGAGDKRQRFLRAFKIVKLEDILAINYAAVVRQVEAKRP